MALGFLCGVEDLVASGSQLVWTVAEQVVRRCYSDALVPCRRFFQMLCHIGDVYQMTEGRQCQVLLLDDRQLELLVQPKLLSRDLLDLVSSHFNLKEKEYFGISFTDETGQTNWLQQNRRVLEHDFSKKTGPLELKFQVRFYIESISFLKDTTTVELFYRNAKSSVYNGSIEVESEHVFKLAAYVLQEAKGDYTSDESARSDLKKLPTFPTAVLKEHPSLTYCEDRVIEHYKTLKGFTRGKAIVKYLLLVESQPTYGVHYYEVKDKQGIPWWLGISYKGIAQYDQQDKLKPRKIFRWKQLENLYFREKKFAVEVNDPQRKASSKRTFGQSGQAIHSWYASHSLIKTIWAMAISQHQFYLDRKQSKTKIATAKSLGDIAMDLTEIAAPRISKLLSVEKDQLIMASNGSLVSAGSADSEVSEELKKEKIAELKKKEKNIQDLLTQKLNELKKICLREAELTGKLPKEYPLESGEKPPAIRKRVGTAFKLDDLFPYDEDPHLRNLESRFALQQKIVEAAKKLASESELCKTVKKKRRRNCLDAMKKLQEIENEINEYRVKTGKVPTQRASLIIADDVSVADLSSLSDSLNLDDDESLITQRQRSRSVQYSPRLSDTLDLPYHSDRRAFSKDEHQDSNGLNYGEVQEPYPYSHRDALSAHNSHYYQNSRTPCDSRSMPPTPQLTRNAFSSIQLRSEDDGPHHFRQRSGSLESQSLFPSETDGPEPVFKIVPPARRSNSTEVLDDVSSHTSQSSSEYCAHSRARNRHQRRKGNIYANTGSMPNLAQNDSRGYSYQPQARPTTTAYYVTGYPCYTEPEPEPYTNGGYLYENEMEGHYNVNPSYHVPAYPTQDPYRVYGQDDIDSMNQNPYATVRQSRPRPPSRNENVAKNMQKAMVAEHLRGWYNRNTGYRHPSYDYDRATPHSHTYRTTQPSYSFADRATSYTSVPSAANASNWRSHLAVGLSEYSMTLHPQHSYSYSSVQYSHPTHSRSYIDVSQADAHVSSPVDSFDSEDQTLYWHEDSKPGTIV
ncbi:FERM domain-containing protein 4B [Hoplias malabaricus]|uniref:FERM domain-containing protein 4B n=1 Tax=Hoplias malabaricus TaxID=27720 RepID=UPI0034620CEE